MTTLKIRDKGRREPSAPAGKATPHTAHMFAPAPPSRRPSDAPADARGVRFDAHVHAQNGDSSPKKDAAGNFIRREDDHAKPMVNYYADSYRHKQETVAPVAEPQEKK